MTEEINLTKMQEEIKENVDKYNKNKINNITSNFTDNEEKGKIKDEFIKFYCIYTESKSKYDEILGLLKSSYISDTVEVVNTSVCTDEKCQSLNNLFNSIYLIGIINKYQTLLPMSDKPIESFINSTIKYLEYLVKYCSYIKLPINPNTLKNDVLVTQYIQLFYKEFLIIYEDLSLISTKIWKQLLYIMTNELLLKDFITKLRNTPNYYLEFTKDENSSYVSADDDKDEDKITNYYYYNFFYLTTPIKLVETLQLPSKFKKSDKSQENFVPMYNLFIYDLVKYLISTEFFIYKQDTLTKVQLICCFELWCKLKCKLLKFKYTYINMVNRLDIQNIIESIYNNSFENKKQLYYHIYLRKDTIIENPRFRYDPPGTTLEIKYYDYPYPLIPTNIKFVNITKQLEQDKENKLYTSAIEWKNKTTNNDVIFRYDDDNKKYMFIKYENQLYIYQCSDTQTLSFTGDFDKYSWLTTDLINQTTQDRVDQLDNSQHTKTYMHLYDFYDYIYSNVHTQSAIDLVENLIKHIDKPICIINNGLTGAGKTSFTLYRKDEKNKPVYGVLYYFLKKLMNLAKNGLEITEGKADEIYSEYNPDNNYTVQYDTISKDKINKLLDIENILSSIIDIMNNKRKSALTLFNPASSRSHLIIYLEINYIRNEDDENQMVQLVLLDLAGRENMFLCETSQTKMKLLDLYISHKKFDPSDENSQYIQEKMKTIDTIFEKKYTQIVSASNEDEKRIYKIMDGIGVFHTHETKSPTTASSPMDEAIKEYNKLYEYFTKTGQVISRNAYVTDPVNPTTKNFYEFYWDHTPLDNDMLIKIENDTNILNKLGKKWYSNSSVPQNLFMIINFRNNNIQSIAVDSKNKLIKTENLVKTVELLIFKPEKISHDLSMIEELPNINYSLISILKPDIHQLSETDIIMMKESLTQYLNNLNSHILDVIYYIIQTTQEWLKYPRIYSIGIKSDTADYRTSKLYYNPFPYVNINAEISSINKDEKYDRATLFNSKIRSDTKRHYTQLVIDPINSIIEICNTIIKLKKEEKEKEAIKKEKLTDFNLKFKQYVLITEECELRSKEGKKINNTLIQFKKRLATSYGYDKIINRATCGDMEFFEYSSISNHDTYKDSTDDFGEDEEIMKSINGFLKDRMKYAIFNILNIVNMSDSILLNNPPYPPYIDITDIIYFNKKLSTISFQKSTVKVTELTTLIINILYSLINYIICKCKNYKYYKNKIDEQNDFDILKDFEINLYNTLITSTDINRKTEFINSFINIIETNNELSVIGSMYPLKASTNSIYISCSKNNYLAALAPSSYKKYPFPTNVEGNESFNDTLKKLENKLEVLTAGSILSQKLNLKTATNDLQLSQPTHRKQLLTNNKSIKKINELNKNNIDKDYEKYIKYKHKYLKLKAALI